jgi:hypothetical protein
MKTGPIVIVVVLASAAAFALLRSPSPAPAPVAAEPPPAAAPPLDGPHGSALPPNHPPIGGGDSPHAAPMGPPSSDEPAAITWKAPDAWASAPNPSTMRLATYKIPAAKGDAEGAELAISRAGGAKEANIQRWVGQFDDAGKDGRAERTVRGMKLTIVDVTGTFMGGGMMPGASAGPKKGWMLLGAIVETTGTPYFFKMTGPAATVRAARPAFEKMLDGIAPAT